MVASTTRALLAATAMLLCAGGRGWSADFHVLQICTPDRGGVGCEHRILVQGPIIERDARVLRAMVPIWSKTVTPTFSGITLASPGGSVSGAIELGREIRRQRLNTIAPVQLSAWDPTSKTTRVVLSQPQCLSACVYAFMGGVVRRVAPGAALGVHRFSVVPGKVAADADARLTVALLREYVQEMGVDASLLALAQQTPTADMRVLSRDEVVSSRLDNQSWAVIAAGDGTPILRIQQPHGVGRMAFISMANSPGVLVVHVVLQVDTESFLLERLARFPVGRPPTLAFVADGREMRLQPVMSWELRRQGRDAFFEAVGTLKHEYVGQLTAAKSVIVGDEGVARGVGVDGFEGIHLTTEGLAAGVRRLMRAP